jgi:tripartite-type tricarboxylate transporter receptor subunit TctC
MNLFKKFLAGALAGLAALGAAAQPAYPTRPIKLIVPFAAGGSTDLIARIVAEHMRKELGQPVIVENRGGAAGALGTAEGARAAPDGYTLTVATVSTMIVYLATREKGEYSLESFVPVTNMASMANVMTVTPSFPASNLTELIKALKANPGKYSFASSGIGSINHMLGESFQAYSGTKLIHVPYKGSGPAMQDVMGGQVNILFDQFPSSKPHIDSGKLKAIGIISPHKLAGYANVMTMEEAGMKGFTDEAWYGLLAPAKAPPEVLARLTDCMKKIMANPDLRARLEQVGARPVGNSPAEFTAQIRREIETMRKLVRERHIRLDE